MDLESMCLVFIILVVVLALVFDLCALILAKREDETFRRRSKIIKYLKMGGKYK